MERLKRWCKKHDSEIAVFIVCGISGAIAGANIVKMQNQKVAGVYMLDIEDGSKLVSLLRRDGKIARFHFPVES